MSPGSLQRRLNLRRWSIWLGLGGVACGLIAYGLLHYGDYLAQQWTKNALAEQGFETEIALDWVGLSGAKVESITLERDGLAVLGQNISISWHPLELLSGQLDSIEAGQLSGALDLSGAGFFSALNEGERSVSLSSGAIYASFGPGDWPSAAALPEADLLQQWWDFPIERLRAPELAIGLDVGDHSTELEFGLELTTIEGRRRVSASGGGADFDFQMSLEDAPKTKEWAAQLSWSGAHLLTVWDAFLPAEHSLSVEAILGQWLEAWETETLEFEALVEGTGPDVSAFSVLLEQGPFWARLNPEVEFQANALSAGITQQNGLIKQAEIVVDFKYISFLDGQTRPMKASVSGVEGHPLRIELPSLHWSRGGEMEVDLAMRGFWTPEEDSGEVQLSVTKAAFGTWSLEPFRWFMSQAEGALSGRFSSLGIERFPDWILANTRFEETASGVFSYSTDLEFTPESTRYLSFSGRVEQLPEDAFKILFEGRDGDEFLLGSVKSEVVEGSVTLDGAGTYPIKYLQRHLQPFYSEAADLVGEGEIEWRVIGEPHRFFPFQAALEVGFKDLKLRAKDDRWGLEGLAGALAFRAVGPFPASQGVQEIRLAKITSGQDAIEDVVVQFDWLTRDQLKVVKVEGSWMGGTVSLAPFEMNLREPPVINSVLRFEGIEAGRLLDDAEQLGFSVDARLHGSLPISYALGSQPTLSKGTLSLRSIDDAKPILRDSLKVAGLLGLPDIANIRARVAKAIESDFRIHSLEVSLFDTTYPDQPIRAVLVGSVLNDEVEIPEFQIVQSHRVDAALRGWQTLLFFFSGGTWSPER